MLLTKRFLPYFATQCLGALNDNIYKNVLLLLVTFSQVNDLPISVDMFVNLAAGVFILPFFLFSAHAGVVADNMDKAKLIRRLKLLEVIIMFSAALAIVSENYMMMLLLLFLTGSQSAYFGPVKYSLLPQALKEDELVTGNAWVEMGTFLSILIGTLSAGILVSENNATLWSASRSQPLPWRGICLAVRSLLYRRRALYRKSNFVHYQALGAPLRRHAKRLLFGWPSSPLAGSGFWGRHI